MVADEGQSLVLVEQQVAQALALTQRCIVLERGRVVHSAASAAQRKDLAALDRWVGVRLQAGAAPAPREKEEA
jgi:branched-chain amino acid transport system ATP-binding protein